MATVKITGAPLTIEDCLVVTAGRWSWLKGYVPRSQTAQPEWTRAVAAGNAVHGLTAQVGHGKDNRPGTGSLRLAEPCLTYGVKFARGELHCAPVTGASGRS
jgi:hypothetical protein